MDQSTSSSCRHLQSYALQQLTLTLDTRNIIRSRPIRTSITRASLYWLHPTSLFQPNLLLLHWLPNPTIITLRNPPTLYLQLSYYQFQAKMSSYSQWSESNAQIISYAYSVGPLDTWLRTTLSLHLWLPKDELPLQFLNLSYSLKICIVNSKKQRAILRTSHMLRIALSLVCCQKSVNLIYPLFLIQTLSTSLSLLFHLIFMILHLSLLLLLSSLVLFIALLTLLSLNLYLSAPILFYQFYFNSLIVHKAKLLPRLYMKSLSISPLAISCY